MSYRIGSLNLRKSYRTTDQDREFYGFIHDLIDDEALDIFTFQEDHSGRVSARIIKNLNGLSNWKAGYVEDELSFIWNANRIYECSKSHEPRIFRDYPAAAHLKREPLYGRFAPTHLDSSNEFRLIDIHLVWGAPIDTRKWECTVAKNEIFQRIDTHRYGNFKRAFTVLLGDYNFDCETCNNISPQNVQTFQDEPTTLKNAMDGYASSYDHFSFDIAKNSSVPYTVSRIDAVGRYFKGDFTRYKECVSDHVPIKLEIF